MARKRSVKYSKEFLDKTALGPFGTTNMSPRNEPHVVYVGSSGYGSGYPREESGPGTVWRPASVASPPSPEPPVSSEEVTWKEIFALVFLGAVAIWAYFSDEDE